MTYAAIKAHIHLDKDFTGAEERQIYRAIRNAYLESDHARAMFDLLLTTEPDVNIEKVNDFSAYLESNVLNIDAHYLDKLVFIDEWGETSKPAFGISLIHEFSHALNNILDPTDAQLAAHDYVGDNVRYENLIRAEMGDGSRPSYYNIVRNNYVDAHPMGFDGSYTDGNQVNLVVISSPSFGHNIDTTGQGNSDDLLMDGSKVANTFLSGAGDDFLYGFDGRDILDGGDGDDYLFGGAGGDILTDGMGNDVLDGGTGNDLAEFTGFKFMHVISGTGGQLTVTDQQSGETDKAKNVEFYRFYAGDAPLPAELTSTFVTHSTTVLEPNDDGYTEASLTGAFEDGLNFFGQRYTSVYVNNNGNLTFGGGLSGYTPGTIGGDSGLAIIAAFWADVDTRDGGGTVSYGYNSAHDSFVATWSNVDYYNANYSQHVSKFNSYQIEIIDQGGGDAEIIIRYGDLNWTTGDASGGTNGLGGSVARAGINSGNDVFQYELPGSGIEGSMLGLDSSSNVGRAGMWCFAVHNGVVDIIGEDYAGLPMAEANDWVMV